MVIQHSVMKDYEEVLQTNLKMHTKNGAYILGTGASFGSIYTTEEMLQAFHRQRKAVGDTEYDKKFADQVFHKCGYDGHSVAISKNDLFRTMTRDEYLNLRRVNLTDIAYKACEKALEDWGGDRSKITHLFWGTTTGAMDSPTIDIALCKRLGFNLDVQRTSIEGMGCLTGFRLLNLARNQSLASPESRILLIAADLKSTLGNSMPDNVSRADIVSVSLFRDAASAAVVGGAVFGTLETPCYEIVHGGSRIIADTEDVVDHREGCREKIELNLSKGLPTVIDQAEPRFIHDLLEGTKNALKSAGNADLLKKLPLSLAEFDVVCHTGGSRVLREVAGKIGVSNNRFASSWATMLAYGNLSGASNLAVLDHQNKRGGRDWVICLSMGPGACLEGSILHRVKDKRELLSPRDVMNLKTTPLGDSQVDAMVSRAINEKIIQNHASIQYPKMWMQKAATLKEKAREYAYWLLSFLMLFSLRLVCYNPSSMDTKLLPVACIILFLTIMSFVVTIISSFTLDRVLYLSFTGVMIMSLGSGLNVVFGPTTLGNSNDKIISLWTTCGFSLLTLGVQIFSITSFVFQGWQNMVGSVLLSIGMNLHACASLIRCIKAYDTNTTSTNEDITSGADIVDVIAIPFFLVALLLIGTRAYIDLRRPFLCPPNFVFYGTLLFGLGEVFGGSALAITALLIRGNEMPFWLPVIDAMARGSLFLATVLLLLAAAITALNLDRTVEYCYPATTVLMPNSYSGIRLCRFSGFCIIAGGIIGFIWHSVIRAQGETIVFETNMVNGIISVFLAAVVCTVAFASCRIARSSSSNFKPINLQVGFTLLGGAYSLRAISSFTGDKGTQEAIGITANAIGISGSLVLVSLGYMLSMGGWTVKPFDPSTYLKSLHPGNYFLLAAFSQGMCFVIWFFGQEAIGYLVLIVSGLLITFLLSMTLHVYKITHSRTSDSTAISSHSIENSENNQSNIAAKKIESTNALEVDVLIVGGGPTGLLLASILGKHGVSVVLVEARSAPVQDARFTVINSASMEHLAQVLDPEIFAELRIRAMPDSTPFGSMLVSGLAHEDAKVLETANAPSRMTLMQDLGNICDTSESRILGSKHASELPIRANQSHQEEVLKKQAEKYETVNVLYGHRLVDFNVVKDETHGEHVVAQICPCENEEICSVDYDKAFTVRSRFIVGTDGPRSTVAKGLGICFDGFLNVGRTRSLLVRAPGLYKKVLSRLGGTFMYQVLRAKYGLCGIVAADPKKELWNFLMIIGEKTKNASSKEICEEFLGTTNFEPIQDRPWRWNFFVARKFRQGPGFLAGDAAHSWPPFGALGGNSGFGDAVNLGWKLASVCKGLGGETVLDSYTTERRQQALQTAMFVMSLTPRAELITKYVIPYADSSLFLRWFQATWYFGNSGKHNGNHFCQGGVQLGMHYNYSPILCSEHPLTDDPWCDYKPIIRAGCRLPFCHVYSADDSTLQVGLYDLVASMGYTIFYLVPESEEPQRKTLSSDVLNALIKFFADVQVPLRVVQDVTVAHLRYISENSSGTRATALDLLEEELLVLVRPDNIVAWHMSKMNIEDFFGVGDGNIDGVRLTLECKTIVATVTGLSPGDRSDYAETFEKSEKHSQMLSYQAWLTKQFRFNTRPFGFLFPSSVSIQNETKEHALEKVRAKSAKRAKANEVPEKIDFTTRNYSLRKDLDKLVKEVVEVSEC